MCPISLSLLISICLCVYLDSCHTQALPMCTIIVGDLNPNSNIADILTLCDGADEPRRTAIDLRDLKPGTPK